MIVAAEKMPRLVAELSAQFAESATRAGQTEDRV